MRKTASLLPSRFVILLVSTCSVLLPACTTAPAARSDRSTHFVPSSQKGIAVPAGWRMRPVAEESRRSDLVLVRIDSSASMVVRELHSSPTARVSLDGENVIVLGNISMQNKLGKEGKGRRVLRAPAAVGVDSAYCVYIYSENALLRRVAVFRSHDAVYEVELQQNDEALSFASVVDAQTALVKSLMKAE